MFNYKQRLGKQGESAVVRWIRQQGGTVIARNKHYSGGELDIVAWWQDRLCFIEVKTRRYNDDNYGGLDEAITAVKLNKLNVAAQAFLQGLVSELPARYLIALVIINNNKQFTIRLVEIEEI
ncbi:MAG: YraN family protein [Candidatus Komeilibacteria bacterium]